MTSELILGLSLSLTGKYAAMGRQAETALRCFVADTNASGGVAIGGTRYSVAIDCFDDASRADRARDIYRELLFTRPRDLIFGPYSSGLVRAVAPLAEQAGCVMVNHGGADDALHAQGCRMLVSVLTPASAYLIGFVELLATLKFWRKRLALAATQTPFATAIAHGLEQAAATRRAWLHGIRLRLKYAGRFDPTRTPELLARALRRNRINAFVSVGSYDHDLAMMRVATTHHLAIPVLGCVAAGISRFRDDLGDDAEGIVGPSQWERDFAIRPDLGPSPGEFIQRMDVAGCVCDYPAAQIYAAGLLTLAAIRASDSLDQPRIRAAFADLHTSTFFGDFELDRASGRQLGHKMLLVQWHEGHKQLIDANSPDTSSLEFPSAWRLLMASAGLLKLHRRDNPSGES
jgi:branched-chain amino acid transport system substrate-binding protein